MNLINSVRVLLFPIPKYTIADATIVANNSYRLSDLDIVFQPDVLIHTLQDLMDLSTQEDFFINRYWLSYIVISDEIDEHNDNIETVITSCQEALDDEWDRTNDGFVAMQDLLGNCTIK